MQNSFAELEHDTCSGSRIVEAFIELYRQH